MAKPLIGVTTYLEQAVRGEWDERFGMVPEAYLTAVEEGGGIPVMLPPQPFDDADIARVLGGIDGLVVSGGADVDPGRYGAERGPHTDDPRYDRDDWEVELVLGAIERRMPVLAICRGLQLLNVALGGTLVQHVPDVSDADHGRTPGGFARTEVAITGGTLVRDVLGQVGDRLSVHCHHHQALDRVADGLVVAAHAGDGLIEAVELPSAPFVVGVQWHPEQDEADRRLFRALVDHAIRFEGVPAPATQKLLQNGNGVEAFPIVDPSTGEAFTEVGMADAAEVDQAVRRAVRAQEGWAALAPADRARLLRRFAAVVDAHVDELADLEVRNAGHPIASARWEAGHVRDVLEYYSGSPERLIGSQIPVAGGIDVTFHEPLGVVAVIVPWNFPMTIAAWGFAPALAAGNAVILKPAEWTPLTALRLAALALEAGLPDGLLQTLPGRGAVAGEALVRHPDVAKVVFTGSTRTGSRVMALAAEQVKPVTLELGGKSANIVFADADLDAAAAAAPGAVFDNAGQDCCARSRLLVERSVLDAFLERLEPAVAAWRVGDPRVEDVQMGPLVSAEHRERVASFVDGSTPVAFRGSAPSGAGFWFAPAVLLPDRPDDRVLREEIFGPVVAVQAFDGEAEAVGLANGTAYGLSGSIWTRDLGRGIRVSRAVRSGALSVNSNSSVRHTTPFGGMKRSGIGRELGPDAPLAFTALKNVFYATGAPSA